MLTTLSEKVNRGDREKLTAPPTQAHFAAARVGAMLRDLQAARRLDRPTRELVSARCSSVRLPSSTRGRLHRPEPSPPHPLVYVLLFLIAVAWNVGITPLIGHQRWLDRRVPRRPR
jgi:hypothetical protein